MTFLLTLMAKSQIIVIIIKMNIFFAKTLNYYTQILKLQIDDFKNKNSPTCYNIHDVFELANTSFIPPVPFQLYCILNWLVIMYCRILLTTLQWVNPPTDPKNPH